MKLLIIGASGHGKVIADIAIKMKRWDTIEFLDDNESIKDCLGCKVIGRTADALKYRNEADIFVAVGNNHTRQKIQEKLEAEGFNIPVLIHPSAIIGTDVQIEKGTVLMAGVVINSSSKIGRGCIINTGVTIDHDNNIEDFVHISPGANLAGTVRIGKNSWVGIGSVISNNISITNDCIIGAGAVVIRDITLPGTYVGVPARSINPKK